MLLRNLLSCSLACALACCVAQAQQTGSHSQPPPAAKLYWGMGDVDHPVSTKNAEAQKFFNQGLALLYGFNHFEAANSFRRAAELDPDLAMAWWGVALVYGPNYNAPADEDQNKVALDAVAKAQALAPKASAPERAYIDAVAKRYAPDPKADKAQLAVAYKDGMCAVARQYPDDLDAATLCAEAMMNLRPWRLWSVDGSTPAEGTPEILAMLEGVLKRNPDHLGANHYYIHATEASRQPGRALASANRLEKLAPSAGHLVHMPSHVYWRVGDFPSAVKVNVAAAEADRKYLAVSKLAGIYPMMYYNHNVHFEALAQSMKGNYAGARRAAEQLAMNAAPHARAMSVVEAFLPVREYMLVRFEKWDDVLKTPKPADDLLYHTANWHYARGMAYAARNDKQNAQLELDALRTGAAKLKPDFLVMLNTGPDILAIAENVLAARVDQINGNKDAAIDSLRKAVAKQDSLVYIEPPEWYFPVREALGATLLSSGDAGEAEQVFRADLDRNPRNGRSLYGLMSSLKAQGKERDASLVEQEFRAAWKDADTQLQPVAVRAAAQ